MIRDSVKRFLGIRSPSGGLAAGLKARVFSDEEVRQMREGIKAALAEGKPPVVLPPACSQDHHTQCGSIEIGDNQDRDCLSLYQSEFADDADTDTIHICDWPALKAAIDQHQRERGGRT